ncbi:hypothetical protein JMJ77_0008385 [Colletotrichum scovillei]|uniref:Uncharacterized protein n=1 Tax=Colletotrichum scovillei TaxID=1209932 RepID=A0A9P7RGW7_9PEZI|nr:hypothetical protein JMJ77_0008385 [Colletotrichum scovillei]KAG7075304.1 hypothetical protein JMJ76_0011764 [Colletotrichum scovillei]KAG7082525.1 hypothetical protein JMJ78_0004626 [Colletotrichum scovillei]
MWLTRGIVSHKTTATDP